ncbi:MAG TPA: 50S ribosomal protein L32 [Firmicutes bacterium]|jgi:large subunit ribosomal protein L32|nr:50S ribosomal protein L32 [Bacillota bacterium]
MAVPKQKQSRSRTRRRRAKWKLTLPGLVECSQCHEYTMPHRVCSACGYYDGKQVLDVDKVD